MLTVLIVLLVFVAPLARAQSPAEMAYLAARDQMIAELEKQHRSAISLKRRSGGAWSTEQDRVKRDLEARLSRVLGISVDGPCGLVMV